MDCTQRECETSEDKVDNYRHMLESRISVGALEKLPKQKWTRIGICRAGTYQLFCEIKAEVSSFG